MHWAETGSSPVVSVSRISRLMGVDRSFRSRLEGLGSQATTCLGWAAGLKAGAALTRLSRSLCCQRLGCSSIGPVTSTCVAHPIVPAHRYKNSYDMAYDLDYDYGNQDSCLG